MLVLSVDGAGKSREVADQGSWVNHLPVSSNHTWIALHLVPVGRAQVLLVPRTVQGLDGAKPPLPTPAEPRGRRPAN